MYKRQGYYKFLCPALPEVREFIKEKIKTYCEVEGLNGIAIDYHRFVDAVSYTHLEELKQDNNYIGMHFIPMMQSIYYNKNAGVNVWEYQLRCV